jgi:hypothetical protein
VGSLAFEGDHGHMAHVSPYTFAALLANHCPPLQCVILNACGGHIQGEILASVVPQTVCFSGRISDKESLIFSRGFYDSIAQGHPVNRAFREGSSRMELHALSPGVPQRKEQVYGGGVLPLVTLLKNDRLYRALHDSCVETVSQAILEKDAKLIADNACLLEENNKLRSLITYGMELLQNKDKDLDAMRRALTMLAASSGNGGKKGGGGGGRINYGNGSALGLLGDGGSNVPPRKRNGASHHSGERPVRWKHVSTGGMGTKTPASAAASVDAPLPSSKPRKPKWYKDIQSSGYGKVSFRSRKAAEADSSSSGLGSRHTSPHLLHGQQPPSGLPPPPSSPLQSQPLKGRKAKATANSSPMRPLSAGKRNQQQQHRASDTEQSCLNDAVFDEVWSISPPALTPVSSSEHLYSSTLILTDTEAGEKQLLVALVTPPPLPSPSASSYRVPPQSASQGSAQTQAAPVARKKSPHLHPAASPHAEPATGPSDTPPRPSSARSRSTATAVAVAVAGRYSQRTMQKTHQQHVISKSTSWAKEYPAGESSTSCQVTASADSSSSTKSEMSPATNQMFSSGDDVPVASPEGQEALSKLPPSTGHVASQYQSSAQPKKRASSQRPVHSSRRQQAVAAAAPSPAAAALSSSPDVALTAPRKSQSKSESGNFREKSAGFRQFLKEKRDQQNAQKPTASFASSVPRFEASPTTSADGGGTVARTTMW